MWISSLCDPSERTQSLALSPPQEDICHFPFLQQPPLPLSGKTEFMSPCISLRQTDGYTRRPRRTYTARQSDCSFYATLFMLYSLMLDSEALFFSCAHYCSVSLLSLFIPHWFYSFLNCSSLCYIVLFIGFHLQLILPSNPLQCQPHSYSVVIFPCPAIDLTLAYASLSLWAKSLWIFPQGKATWVCFYNIGNGLVSEALISS